jgi:hypothetical protein
MVQDELSVYESCMNYVIEHCNNDMIYETTGCTKEELKDFADDITNMLKSNLNNDTLPDKYKI